MSPSTKYRPPQEFPGYGACERCGCGTMMCDEEDRWCAKCYGELGMSPPSVNDHRVRDRSRRPAPRAVLPIDPPVLPDLPAGGYAVVQVAYPLLTGGTLPLMVGKVVAHPSHGRIFYHAFSQTGEGGQAHHQTDCPCPVDRVVLDWLNQIGVQWVYCYDRDAQVVYKAPETTIRAAPLMEYAAKTVRTRHYLPRTEWLRMSGVLERHKGKDVRLIRAAGSGQGEALVLTVPYIPDSATVVLPMPERW